MENTRGTLLGLGKPIHVDGVLIGFLHENWIEIEGCKDKKFLGKLFTTIMEGIKIREKLFRFKWAGFKKAT